MADIDKQCHKDKLGPYEPIPRKTGVRDSSCDILFLKPRDPLATPEGRFAHSIQLPAPYNKPKEIFKPGMSSVEYFKALCEAEAGGVVLRTVENVDGIYEMRPGEHPGDYGLMHLYANEGPTGDQMGDFDIYIGQSLVQPNAGQYEFVETSRSKDNVPDPKQYIRYYRDALAN